MAARSGAAPWPSTDTHGSATGDATSIPTAGFRLPSSFGRFYPDFVCELTEGGLFVVEYKGEQIRGVAKEIEKAQVESSGGHCLFAFIYRQAGGMNVSQ